MTSKGPGLLQHARQPWEHRFTRYRSCPIYLRKNDPLSWVQVTPDTSEVVTPDTSEVDDDTMDVDAAERQFQRTTGIAEETVDAIDDDGVDDEHCDAGRTIRCEEQWDRQSERTPGIAVRETKVIPR